MSYLANPHVVNQAVTCWACPVQIEGQLDDGRYYYFRYRSGYASLGVGPTGRDAIADRGVGMSHGDGLQGVFDSDEDLNGVFDALLARLRQRGAEVRQHEPLCGWE